MGFNETQLIAHMEALVYCRVWPFSHTMPFAHIVHLIYLWNRSIVTRVLKKRAWKQHLSVYKCSERKEFDLGKKTLLGRWSQLRINWLAIEAMIQWMSGNEKRASVTGFGFLLHVIQWRAVPQCLRDTSCACYICRAYIELSSTERQRAFIWSDRLTWIFFDYSLVWCQTRVS